MKFDILLVIAEGMLFVYWIKKSKLKIVQLEYREDEKEVCFVFLQFNQKPDIKENFPFSDIIWNWFT